MSLLFLSDEFLFFFQTVLHILHVKQSASIRKIENLNSWDTMLSSSSAFYGDDEGAVVRAGTCANVRFEFSHKPEYIREGMRLIFRDGAVRGVGKVIRVY